MSYKKNPEFCAPVDHVLTILDYKFFLKSQTDRFGKRTFSGLRLHKVTQTVVYFRTMENRHQNVSCKIDGLSSLLGSVGEGRLIFGLMT